MNGSGRKGSGPPPDRLRRKARCALLHVLLVGAALLSDAAASDISAQGALADTEIPFHHVTSYRVTVETPADAEIAIAPWAEGLPGLTVVPGDPVITPLPDGRKRWVCTMRLTPTSPQRYTLPPLTVLVDGAPAARLEPGSLNVRALTPEELADVAAPQPLLTLADLAPRLSPGRGRLVLAGAALLTAVVGVLVWRRARHLWSRKAPPRDPLAEALDALEALEAAIERGGLNCDAIYSRIAAVMRTYLERGYGLQVRELSTPELAAGPLADLPLADGLRSELVDVLVDADRVKFAQAERSPERQRETLQAAREIVIALDTPVLAESRGAA